MKIETSDRGFNIVRHPENLPPHKDYRLVQESSAIGDYPDAGNRPGSSFLWIGNLHHLNREEVAELRDYLTCWLVTGHLMDRP